MHASDPFIAHGYLFLLWILMMMLMDYDFMLFVICVLTVLLTSFPECAGHLTYCGC
jgi:hypothetical protein